ncbi:MAG: hypothetical protein DRP82_01625 [Planctomycetota bacterium]|nr:MAG: hypothetical protein DRP82_01625 [Planctomycetota bacterium]
MGKEAADTRKFLTGIEALSRIKVIALTGAIGSGQTTIARYLEEHGASIAQQFAPHKEHRFVHIKVSEVIHFWKGKCLPSEQELQNFCQEQGIEGEDMNDLKKLLKEIEQKRKGKRRLAQAIGNALRKNRYIEKDPNKQMSSEPYWEALAEVVRRALEEKWDEIEKSEPNCFVWLVIDCVKNPGEIYWLRSRFPDCFVVGVYASPDKRFGRLQRKFNKSSNYTRDVFNEEDKCDQGVGEDPWGQNVAGCFQEADYIVNNDDPCETRTFLDIYMKPCFPVAAITRLIKLILVPGREPPLEDERLMNWAYAASLQSRCIKRQVGAVVAKNGYALAIGWNGAPPKCKECYEKSGKCYREGKMEKLKETLIKELNENERAGLDLDDVVDIVKEHFRALDYCRALHAEENAILQTALFGTVSLEGAVLYTTTFPCYLCAKKIAKVGIKKVVYCEPYPMEEAQKILKEAGVEYHVFQGAKGMKFYRLFKIPAVDTLRRFSLGLPPE